MYKLIEKLYNRGEQREAYKKFLEMLNIEESKLYKKYLNRYKKYLPKIDAEKQLLGDFILTMARYIEDNHEDYDSHGFYSMVQHQIRVTYNIEMGFTNEKTKLKNGEEYVKVPKYITFNTLMENSTAVKPVQEYIVLLDELSEYLISRYGEKKFRLFEARYIHHETFPEISYYSKKDGSFDIGACRVEQICKKMKERAAKWLNRR